MSISNGRSSPFNRVQELMRAIEEARVQEISSTEDRYRKYVNIMKDKEGQLPQISYKEKRFCCSVSKICSTVSCCFQSRCCGRETINFYVSEMHGDQILLRSRASASLPSQEQNQLTNTSFFIDLYQEHGEFLPFMISSAIEYLPTPELKEYWRLWDPESTEHLDRKRAEDFKRLLIQTHHIYDEVRMEMMKKEMRERLVHLPPKDQVRTHLSVRTQKALPATTAPLKQLATSEEMIFAGAERKFIDVGGKLKEFTKDRVIKDLLLITTCNDKEAFLAAQEVEKFLSPITTTEEIWEILLQVVYLHELKIRASYANMITNQLLRILEEDRPKRVIDISREKFASLIKAQQEANQDQQDRSKKLTEKEATGKFQQRQPRNFTIDA